MYALGLKYAGKFIKKSVLFKYGFNLSPMFRRTTGRIVSISDDLLNIKIKIALSYRNSNYVGTIFGGSLFAAADPFYMVQLINVLGDNYVVWDKESNIKFKRPAKETVFANFTFSLEEIEQIKQEVVLKRTIDWVKKVNITNKDGSVVIAEVSKTIYIADKTYFKEKRARRK